MVVGDVDKVKELDRFALLNGGLQTLAQRTAIVVIAGEKTRSCSSTTKKTIHFAKHYAKHYVNAGRLRHWVNLCLWFCGKSRVIIQREVHVKQEKTMSYVLYAASRYVQGEGEIEGLAERLKQLGKKYYLLLDSTIYEMLTNKVEKIFARSSEEYRVERFGGECSQQEIYRQMEMSQGYDVIIGMGGGKTISTAKAMAHYQQCKVVVVPTSASSNMSYGALVALYSSGGAFETYLVLNKNPDLVLVDTAIVAKAPIRLLISGIGDAISTYFEVRATKRSMGKTLAGGRPTQAALSIAQSCYEVLRENAFKAVCSARNGLVSRSLEQVIEANILLSGIGSESGGLAAAHAINNGLTVLEATHDSLRGEKVAFCTLAQLVLENADLDEINEVLELYKQVGLPMTLEEIGIEVADPEHLRNAAKVALVPGDTMGNMPFNVTEDLVLSAILTADKFGHLYQENGYI